MTPAIWWRAHHFHLRRINAGKYPPRPPKWPTRLEWLIVALMIAGLSAAAYAYDTARLRWEAELAVKSYQRLENCINGIAPLGYLEEHGAKWAVVCKTEERMVTK